LFKVIKISILFSNVQLNYLITPLQCKSPKIKKRRIKHKTITSIISNHMKEKLFHTLPSFQDPAGRSALPDGT
jgi:hypothetical protein